MDNVLAIVALTSAGGLVAAMWIRKILLRRRAFQEFAAEKRFEFVGTIPSDGRVPYKRIQRVAQAVLLTNLVEGQWDGLPVRVFDMPWRRRGAKLTTVLVVVEDTLRRGALAEGVLAARPDAMIDIDLDILIVTPARLLDASELAEWLTFATALAKAMERDFKQSLVS
jgi:hypothetical protein